MTNGNVTMKFGILSAANLPPTDRSSLIDPYVVATFSTGSSFKTKCLKNNDAPMWNEFFAVNLSRRLSASPDGLFGGGAGGGISGSVSFVLFDQNTFKDAQVMKASLDLSTLTPAMLSAPSFTIPLEPVKDKYRPAKGNATLTLCFEGSGADTFESIQSRLAGAPGFIADAKNKSVYFPVPGSKGLVYLGLKYEKKSIFDVSLYITQPNLALYLDINIGSPRPRSPSEAANGSGAVANGRAQMLRKLESKKRPSCKFYRNSFTDGVVLAPDLKVYEMYKADDVPAGTDFSSIQILAYRCEPQVQIGADKVVAAHGWKGALTFTTAAEHLDDVLVDRRTQEIFMDVVPGQSMLLVDFDDDNVDIKLAVLDTPDNAKRGYEISIKRQVCKRQVSCYNPPLSRMDGRLQVSKILQLDDVNYGTSFSDIRIRSFRLDVPLVSSTLQEAIDRAASGNA